MADPTFIKTPNGDEVVVLLREDYERLIRAANESTDDDRADIALAEERLVDWERAGRPVVPLAVIKHVRAGESYMRAFRTYRSLTQEQLAIATGLAQGFLSDVEGGRKGASPAALAKIASALDMHVCFLMETPVR